MEKRAWSLVLVLLFVFVTGCVTPDVKPVVAPPAPEITKDFRNGIFQFLLRGEAVHFMEKVEAVQEETEKGKSPKEIEESIYQMYVKADTDRDHVITPEEAKAFWTLYQRQYDNQMGSGSIRFK